MYVEDIFVLSALIYAPTGAVKGIEAENVNGDAHSATRDASRGQLTQSMSPQDAGYAALRD